MQIYFPDYNYSSFENSPCWSSSISHILQHFIDLEHANQMTSFLDLTPRGMASDESNPTEEDPTDLITKNLYPLKVIIC